MSLMSLMVKTDRVRIIGKRSRKHLEADLVLIMPRGRLRLYLGHSAFPRERFSTWQADGHAGVVLRLHTDARDQHVVGAQWRPPRAHDMR